MLFVGTLICWLLFPFMQIGVLAQDAIPFIAAGRIVSDAPHEIYTTDPAVPVPVALRNAGCELAPAGADCVRYVPPFLSTPHVLPLMKLVGTTSGDVAILLLRLLGSAAFVGAFAVLWSRVAKRSRDAQVPLLVTVVLLTPYVFTSSALGQNASFMVLSAAVGMGHDRRWWRDAGAAAAWVMTVLFKVFPLPLLVLAVARRRWRFAFWAVAQLVVVTLVTSALVPWSLYRDFVTSTTTFAPGRVALPQNISIDRLINLADPGWRGSGALYDGGVVARVLGIGALAYWRLRDVDEDVQWAYAWVALLAVFPQVWWHYAAVVVPALVYVLRERCGPIWWWVPTAATIMLALAVVTDTTVLTLLGSVAIAAAVVGIPMLIRPNPPHRMPEAQVAST